MPYTEVMANATATRKPKSTGPKAVRTVRDAAEETTKSMLAHLEAGVVPWQKPWSSASQIPLSLSSGKPYRGVNVFTLLITGWTKGYTSSYWGTYKQISERGGQVRKGEKGAEVILWRPIEKTEKVDGKDTKKKILLMRLFHVFNVDQADWAEGARLPAVPEKADHDPIQDAEALVAEYVANGPDVTYFGDRAFYRPVSDQVVVPELADFESAEHFYSTLYHELTHSTGHSSRLARDGIAQGTFGAFGDKVYSNEELIAEMGAAMLCALAGINQAATAPASAAYLAHWIDALKGDKSLIIKAASAAQKAVDRIVGTTFPQDNGEEES